jgi:CubicO group peptidase (beta-lactamase class C family)
MRPSTTSAARWLLVGLLCASATVSLAGDLKSTSPARAGMSDERLARLTTHMNQQVEKGIMVGGQGLIARNGKIVYNETYGDLDREQDIAMPEDAIYRIYSMSKPITAVALMMLYEEGKFSLNEPVAKYIPQLADLQLSVATAGGEAGTSDGVISTAGSAEPGEGTGETRAPLRQPTIRDLLRHTAGMTYGIFGDTEVDRNYREAELFAAPDLETFVTRLGKQPLQFEPGSRWHYSVSVDVQGRLVEVLSGLSFGEFLQQRIFAPLGMDDTSFILPSEKRARLAQIYSPKGTSATWGGAWKNSYSPELEVSDERVSQAFLEGGMFESGGGGLLSTADDYLRFCLMLINGGQYNGVRLLSPKTIELMTRNHTGDLKIGWSSTGVSFGLGFGVITDTGEVGEIGSDGEYSWGGAAGTRFWVDPQEQLIGIFMVQSIPHQTRLRDEFRQLTYQAIVE